MPNFYSPYQYPQQYGYQPQQQMQQQMPQQMAQQIPQQPIQQIQNGGFLTAPNEEYVRTYPVALGNCVTFKIEGKPYVMEKSMGFSQLDSPKIEKYRLVKEEPEEPSNSPEDDRNDNKAINDTLEGLISEIEAIKADVKAIKEKLKSITKPAPKKVPKDEDDDDE
jgi:hypothetical protein